MKKIVIHTDGGCHGNPGPGGWAATLAFGEHTRVVSGGALATTNNRMELTAAIEALQTLKEPCAVEFFTDSQYLRQGITSWLRGWKMNGWRTRQKTAVKNEDLWRALDAAAAKHAIEWKWLKGHAGHVENERCDQLTQEEIAKIKRAYTAEELREAREELAARDKADAGQQVLF